MLRARNVSSCENYQAYSYPRYTNTVWAVFKLDHPEVVPTQAGSNIHYRHVSSTNNCIMTASKLHTDWSYGALNLDSLVTEAAILSLTAITQEVIKFRFFITSRNISQYFIPETLSNGTGQLMYLSGWLADSGRPKTLVPCLITCFPLKCNNPILYRFYPTT